MCHCSLCFLFCFHLMVITKQRSSITAFYNCIMWTFLQKCAREDAEWALHILPYSSPSSKTLLQTNELSTSHTSPPAVIDMPLLLLVYKVVRYFNVRVGKSVAFCIQPSGFTQRQLSLFFLFTYNKVIQFSLSTIFQYMWCVGGSMSLCVYVRLWYSIYCICCDMFINVKIYVWYSALVITVKLWI